VLQQFIKRNFYLSIINYNAVHITPPPDNYLMRCLQRAEERERFAREQELRWRTMLYEHLDGSNNHKIYWAWRFGLLLFLISGFYLFFLLYATEVFYIFV
jgi:hypothetical protein